MIAGVLADGWMDAAVIVGVFGLLGIMWWSTEPKQR